ncbi:trigger factor [Yaniella halotolerans]|uniref:trigger factor n=1 Tax=Yaniella halotolerans TaxID=225453 RepID=UPI0003B71204|nr:trigger factor [Yaniella halotolerans]
MVQSTVENLAPTRVKLEVEVPFDELKPRIDATYKSLADQIQVPGFRKGKVPAKLIDQRVGRGFVIENAVNDNLDAFFQEALREKELTPLTRPEVDVTSVPGNEGDDEAPLKFNTEFDVRPTIDVPDYKGLEVTVEPITVTEEQEAKVLDDLRERFATLVDVDRPAEKGDNVTIGLTATIDDEEVDSAEGLSYEIGSGSMLDGMDEALEGLSAGEDAVFETTLAGGEHSGETATVKVVLDSVKERELPEADDDFAQLASEFDTIEELKEDLKNQATEESKTNQGVEAREKALEELLKLVEVDVPENMLTEQVEQHFTSQGHAEGDDHDTEEHREEVTQNFREAFVNEVVLDTIADAEEVQVDQSELIEYIVSSASQYGMEPNQFAQMLDQAGQVPMIMGEVRRRKALAAVLEVAKVVDTNGNEVDLSFFLTPEGEEETASEENVDEDNS